MLAYHCINQFGKYCLNVKGGTSYNNTFDILSSEIRHSDDWFFFEQLTDFVMSIEKRHSCVFGHRRLPTC